MRRARKIKLIHDTIELSAEVKGKLNEKSVSIGNELSRFGRVYIHNVLGP
jgi:hypothetical protein